MNSRSQVDMVKVRQAVSYFTCIEPPVVGQKACYIHGKTLVSYVEALREALYQAGERARTFDLLTSENHRLKALLKERETK